MLAFCVNCGGRPTVAKGRCSSCYKWLRYKGVERPARLWDLDAMCENPHCRRPLARVRRRYRALCEDCHLYWSLTGEYRPRRFCNKRWCDCGAEAAHEMVLRGGKMTKTGKIRERGLMFWLCEACYRVERGE